MCGVCLFVFVCVYVCVCMCMGLRAKNTSWRCRRCQYSWWRMRSLLQTITLKRIWSFPPPPQPHFSFVVSPSCASPLLLTRFSATFPAPPVHLCLPSSLSSSQKRAHRRHSRHSKKKKTPLLLCWPLLLPTRTHARTYTHTHTHIQLSRCYCR